LRQNRQSLKTNDECHDRWNPPKKKAAAGKGWRYAGAMDVPLSEVRIGQSSTHAKDDKLTETIRKTKDGIQEAIEAGHRLKHLPFDVVYCSMLMRAQMTALIALASHDSEQTPLIVRDNPDPNSVRGLRAHLQRMHNPTPAVDEETTGENEDETNRVIPVYCSHALNERDFGELQGMHSRMQRRLFRAEQLEAWRCGWADKFPGESGESSKDVSDRVVAFYERHIRGKLESGSNVMIVAHGFVQRVLIKHLIGMSDHEWVQHMKLESHPDVSQRKASKLLAQNAVPVIFSYSTGDTPEDKSVVRIDTFVNKMTEMFAEEEEGMYHVSGKKVEEEEKKKKKKLSKSKL
jgi:2,3-bisphosphoglycerate-dependent phosphoglycerate mutase